MMPAMASTVGCASRRVAAAGSPVLVAASAGRPHCRMVVLPRTRCAAGRSGVQRRSDPQARPAGRSRLVEPGGLAEVLGLERLWVKDESWLFGLPAFNFLGASWAAFLALCERFDLDPGTQRWPFDELVASARSDSTQLLAATDGNHGRAVARVTRLFRCSCTILVPAGTAEARIDAIRGGEGVSRSAKGPTTIRSKPLPP